MIEDRLIVDKNKPNASGTKNFCFTVDDNIRFLKELNESSCTSIFEHPYLGMYRHLHERYGLKIQLNLFYEMNAFDLSQMTDRYREEWLCNADWLKLSFHSRMENVKPYQASDYKEVFEDCERVHSEILRFASLPSLAKTTTLHYCLATNEGLLALKDNGVCGLLGLYGTNTKPRSSYQSTALESNALRNGEVVSKQHILYAGIDIILNCHTGEKILRRLQELSDRNLIKVMIHEQYFYSDYPQYQPDFEEKLQATFEFFRENGYNSIFFEELLP